MSGTLTQTDVSFTFNWKIPKFLESPDKYIVSPEFSVCDSKNTTGKCVLKVYPKGEKDSKEYVALYLKNISAEEKILCFTLCIIDRGGNKREIISTPERDDGYSLESNASWKFDFVPIDALKKKDSTLLSKDGTLTINLDIHKPGPPNCPVTSLLKDLEDCFEDMKFSDKQIVCQGKKFDVHQFVLSARSPYFAAMFSGGFKEGKSNEIVIDSIQPNILEVNKPFF